MFLESRRVLCLLLASLVPFGLMACDDDDDGDGSDMVSISGTVINIDTLTPAVGVQVSILDTDYDAEVVTGDDGAFLLRVPRGTELYIHTDDAPGSSEDLWFPFINVEVPQLVANDNISGLITHACPNSSNQTCGSVAIWDEYLANDDETNGDLFDAPSCAESSGVVTVLFQNCVTVPAPEYLPGDSLSVTFDEPAFRPGYMEGDFTFGVGNCVQPNPIIKANGDVTDWSGWVTSFGDPGFSGDTVSVSFTEKHSSRGFEFDSPVTIPVRPGTITVVWAIAIDGQGNQSVNALVGACPL